MGHPCLLLYQDFIKRLIAGVRAKVQSGVRAPLGGELGPGVCLPTSRRMTSWDCTLEAFRISGDCTIKRLTKTKKKMDKYDMTLHYITKLLGCFVDVNKTN